MEQVFHEMLTLATFTGLGVLIVITGSTFSLLTLLKIYDHSGRDADLNKAINAAASKKNEKSSRNT